MWNHADVDPDDEDEREQYLLTYVLRFGRAIASHIFADDLHAQTSRSEPSPSEPSPSELCPVCLDNETQLSDRRSCCDQPICQTCLERHIRSKLDDGVFRVVCPNPGCDSLIEVDELWILDPELARQYYRRLVDINADPRRKTCPNCSLVTEVESSEAIEDGLVISCVECQFRWCFQCHGPQHPGVKCEKNRNSDHKLQRWAKRKRTAYVPQAQQCPVCKVRLLVRPAFGFLFI